MRKYAEVIDRIIANSVLSVEYFFDGSFCWEWTGKMVASRTGSGRRYPVMTVWVKGKGPRNVRVHRVILSEIKGDKLRAEHVAAHRCNNPFCVNPEHLRRDTQSGNMRQCVAEGRHNSNGMRDFDNLDAAA